jgi:four helix bundle protein
MGVRSYQELTVWQKAMDLVEVIYAATRSWPKEEIYSLTSQVRRAGVSVASNIAEGQGRNSTKEFLHHLSMAYGSLCEVETQLLVAQRLDYLNSDTAKQLLTATAEVGRLLNGLSRSLNDKLTADH